MISPRTGVLVVLVLVALAVPALAGGPFNVNDFYGPKNYTVIRAVGTHPLFGGESETIDFSGSNFFSYNAAEIGNKPITGIWLDTPAGDGVYDIELTFNNGDVLTCQETLEYTLFIFTRRVTVTCGPDSVNWTTTYDLLVGADTEIYYGYNLASGTWALLLGSHPWYIDPYVFDFSPSSNPLLSVEISGPNEITGKVYINTFKSLADEEEGTKSGYSGLIGILLSYWDTIFNFIATAFNFLYYFVTMLPLIFVTLEAGMFAIALEKKNIFKSIETWFKYNKQLIGGVLSMFDMIVGMITKVIEVILPW